MNSKMDGHQQTSNSINIHSTLCSFGAINSNNKTVMFSFKNVNKIGGAVMH